MVVVRALEVWSARLLAFESDIAEICINVQAQENVTIEVIFVAPPLLGVSMSEGRHSNALLKSDSRAMEIAYSRAQFSGNEM